jgi:hypothetical protein
MRIFLLCAHFDFEGNITENNYNFLIENCLIKETETEYSLTDFGCEIVEHLKEDFIDCCEFVILSQEDSSI